MSTDNVTEWQNGRATSSAPLGTAQWMGTAEALSKFSFDDKLFKLNDDGLWEGRANGQLWVGETFEGEPYPIGYQDDRHILLVSGTRGGKGTGVIIPNLCLWPGSCIVIDPKGENAAVTARRRGAGSAYTYGLKQTVRILDPFGEVQLDASLKARYNPLDAIDPESDLAVDDAGRIAAALVVVENQHDPFWEQAARNLIKALILHVLTATVFEGRRNLVSVWRLLRQGDWLTVERAREAGQENIPSGFTLLWHGMKRNGAYSGLVAGEAEQMLDMHERTRSGILKVATTATEFIDGPPMQRLLEASDFDLAAIKTDPAGLTVYLTLPQRYMTTHFRWLRLMISLAVGDMEAIKAPPATGHPTLFVLDEFAGLKRMEAIENAAAQAAGFGVKFLFVLQNLPQLKEIYRDAWETFLGNSGLRLFFQVDDNFTRKYLAEQLGESEVVRQTRSGSQSDSSSVSDTLGESTSTTMGTSSSVTGGETIGTSSSVTDGKNSNRSWSSSSGSSNGNSLNFKGMFGFIPRGHSRQSGSNQSDSVSQSGGWSRSKSDSRSRSHSRSQSQSDSQSRTGSTSTSRSESRSRSSTDGWGEAVHKRYLLTPDEIGRFLSRIDDRGHPGYPGMALALIPGEQALAVRRVNYFQSPWFEGYFDPHPDHPAPLTLAERIARMAELRKKIPEPEPPPPQPAAPQRRSRVPDYVAVGVAAVVLALGGIHWLASSKNRSPAPTISQSPPPPKSATPEQQRAASPMEKVAIPTPPTPQKSVAQILSEAEAAYGAKDYGTAMRLYRSAADQGSVKAEGKIGLLYLYGDGVARDPAEGLRWLKKSADQGFAEAQNAVGALYMGEMGIERNDAQALYWLRKAADQGNAKARGNIGVLYYMGQGVTQDYAQAFHWLHMAAKEGIAAAQYKTGYLYMNGQGVTQDHSEALRWFRKAADQGDIESLVEIGFFYAQGWGVSRDYSEALRWYRKAADQGNVSAQYNIGLMYLDGHGVPQDFTEAGRWIRKAAEQGLAAAQVTLGQLLASGRGTKQNYEEAFRWLRQAAQQNNAEAQLSLGQLIAGGQGTSRNFPEALQWLRKAADQGNATAQGLVGVFYAAGHGVAPNVAEALKWWRKAVEQEDSLALYNLGIAYATGAGVSRDLAQARKWMLRAAATGFDPAKKWLASR